VTDYDIVDVLVGKTIPYFGRLFLGYYIGNHATLVNGKGEADNQGAMIAMDHGFWNVKDKNGDEYSRLVFAADWASGKNYVGGGGPGLYYYFTKNISLLTGPCSSTKRLSTASGNGRPSSTSTSRSSLACSAPPFFQ